MKLTEELKENIDNYFDNTSPEELWSKLTRDQKVREVRDSIREDIKNDDDFSEDMVAILTDIAMVYFDQEPTREEVEAAGFDWEEWHDPEVWDDKEYRFKAEWELNRLKKKTEERRLKLVDALKITDIYTRNMLSWKDLISIITERLEDETTR